MGKPPARHPSADSDEELAQARINADTVLQTVSEDDIDEVLLDACRQMPLGQLAYVLLHLENRTDNFPPRDYAVATAFKERYDKRVN